MKLLLVAENDATRSALAAHLRPRGFDFIHYRDPIKAMDNIDEIEPEIILFSAEDFPRHWKPFVKLLRESWDKEETAFVLLTGGSFNFDEAAKANHLEVNAMISENPEDRDEIRKLEEVVTRYSGLKDGRVDLRYFPDDAENLEFVVTHPKSYRVITGVLFDLSPSGAAFVPDDPRASADIQSGSRIDHCSLNLDGQYFKMACNVVRNSGRIALKFLGDDPDLQEAIVNYIDLRAERELSLLLGDQ